MLALLHLCDSLFPIGSFAHSDGLEAAVAADLVMNGEDLEQWMDACLDETFGRCEGPAVALSWESFLAGNWDTLAQLDEEIYAMRPSSTARTAARAMGARLIRTWQQIRPHEDLAAILAESGDRAFTLPVAFGTVCAAAGIDERLAVEGYVYTRLAATISSAMRLLPIGQHEAHAVLARTLSRAPSVVDALLERPRQPTQFTPALDLAVMSQQYVRSRLFRS